MDIENNIATAIIDESFAVHSKFGPGLLESAYEKILTNRLRNKGLIVETQKSVSIIDDGSKIEDAFRIDMLVNDVVIVELKSVESLPNVAAKQLKTYLSLTGVKLGILINFGEKSLKDGIKRIVVSP